MPPSSELFLAISVIKIIVIAEVKAFINNNILSPFVLLLKQCSPRLTLF